MDEIFESSIRSENDFAGVFEFDGEVSYFYLYQLDSENGNKVVGSIRVSVGPPYFNNEDIELKWSPDEKMVALYIANLLVCVFDCESRNKYGGDYKNGSSSTVPESIANYFSIKN